MALRLLVSRAALTEAAEPCETVVKAPLLVDSSDPSRVRVPDPEKSIMVRGLLSTPLTVSTATGGLARANDTRVR